MNLIPKLAERTGRQADLIQALKTAFSNDAKIVKNKLGVLPPDWVSQIDEDDFPF